MGPHWLGTHLDAVPKWASLAKKMSQKWTSISVTIILMSLCSINFKKDVVSYISVRRPSSVNCTTKMVTEKKEKIAVARKEQQFTCWQPELMFLKWTTVYVLTAWVDVSEVEVICVACNAGSQMSLRLRPQSRFIVSLSWRITTASSTLLSHSLDESIFTLA